MPQFNAACAEKGILAIPPGASDDEPKPINIRFLKASVLKLKKITEPLSMEGYMRGEYIKVRDSNRDRCLRVLATV